MRVMTNVGRAGKRAKGMIVTYTNGLTPWAIIPEVIDASLPDGPRSKKQRITIRRIWGARYYKSADSRNRWTFADDGGWIPGDAATLLGAIIAVRRYQKKYPLV
jgi:hypothetical protein